MEDNREFERLLRTQFLVNLPVKTDRSCIVVDDDLTRDGLWLAFFFNDKDREKIEQSIFNLKSGGMV